MGEKMMSDLHNHEGHDHHDHGHDESDDPTELVNSLTQIIDKGPPEVVLENPADDDIVSEALATLYEMDRLGEIAHIPTMTPDWSLAIRRFLESYSEGVELEGGLVQIGTQEENSRFMYGFGILLDGYSGSGASLPSVVLEKIRGSLSSLFQLKSPSLVYVHPTMATLSELYLFSFEERREFFLEVPDSSGPIPFTLGGEESDEGFLSASTGTLLGENHPVVQHFGDSAAMNSGEPGYPVVVLGAVILDKSPLEGGIQEFLEGEDSGLFESILSEIGEMLSGAERDEEEESPSVSILPWSLLLPMGVSLHFQQRVMEYVHRLSVSGKETLEMVPFWENGYLWIHATVKGRQDGRDFLVVDEYILEFLEDLIEPVFAENLPLRLKWHPLPKEGRDLSLGLV